MKQINIKPNNFAVFVPASPPPAPPAPPAEGCAYQVEVNGSPRTYKCFTQAQWDARNSEQARYDAQAQHDWDTYWQANGAAWGWGITVAIVIFIVCRIIWRRRHPKPKTIYDIYGLDTNLFGR